MLSFEGRLAVNNTDGFKARLKLRTVSGKTVLLESGKSVLRLEVPVTAGTYELTLATDEPLRHRDLANSLRLTFVAPPTPTPTPTPTLADAVCGTWAHYQVSSVSNLESMRSKIEDTLALPGVVGLSVRFPWDAADISGSQTTHPILDTAKDIADSQGKALSIRFIAGAHTPARVFNAGAAFYLSGSHKVPLPWNNTTGDHQVFLDAYDAYLGKLAAWSRANDVSHLHLSWYGQDWAELNHGAELRAASGYTQSAWLTGHRELIAVGASHASSDLAVELPMSGYGPLSGGQAAALTDAVISNAGASSPELAGPRPGPAYSHNTLARVAQLEQEIAAYAQRTC